MERKGVGAAVKERNGEESRDVAGWQGGGEEARVKRGPCELRCFSVSPLQSQCLVQPRFRPPSAPLHVAKHVRVLVRHDKPP